MTAEPFPPSDLDCSRCGRLQNTDGSCWACDQHVTVTLARGEVNALINLGRLKGRANLSDEARRAMDALYGVSLNAEVEAFQRARDVYEAGL